MPVSLKEIKAPIAKELILFENHFKDSMRSHIPLLNKITYYLVKRKGKQIRPLFIFLSAKLWGDINEKTHTAASLIELLHTATLVHDDVVDDSHLRRGFFSINALWKNKIAVLVGDYLLSRGFLLAVDNGHFDLLQILSTAVKKMSEGELLQIEKARKLDIEESIYYDIINQKTASLIAASCASGLASVRDDEKLKEEMRQFGEYIGMAFQIKDDLFDYGEASIGKPRGIDIKEKKMTLPLIYTLNNISASEKRRVINDIKKHSTKPNKVREIIKLVKETGGLEYAEKVMHEYHKKAMDALSKFPQNEANESLKNLIDFVIFRKK